MNFYSIALLLGTFQGILVSIVLLVKKGNNLNKWLAAFLILISITLFIRALYEIILLSNVPQFVILPDILIFIYGPTLGFYFSNLTHQSARLFQRKIIHFIPAFIHLLFLTPLLFTSKDIFLQRLTFPFYTSLFLWIEGLGITHNILYAIFIYRSVKNIEKTDTNRQLLKGFVIPVLLFIMICLLCWAIGYCRMLFFSLPAPGFFSYNYVWIGLSVLAYVIGYYAISSPHIFLPLAKKYKSSAFSSSKLHELKIKLESVMKEKQCYLQPELTLKELAKTIDVTPNELSWAINEGFQVSFSDFINAFRIQQFIDWVQQGKSKDITYLGIAFESGFNSKTTFNNAFKKFTGKSPRAYFQKAPQ